jgi:hypothetical protein
MVSSVMPAARAEAKVCAAWKTLVAASKPRALSIYF